MKKIISLALVIMLVLSMTMVVGAKNNVPAIGDTTQNNVGFHCNAGKGNGKVTLSNYNGQIIDLVKAGYSDAKNSKAIWEIVSTEFECPVCKRIDWANFSNNSGIPNGKNIQVNHTANPRYLAYVKVSVVLLDLDGEVDSSEVVFEKRVVAPGTFGWTENTPEGYELVDITVNGSAVTAVNIVMPAAADQSYVVVYTFEPIPEDDGDFDFSGIPGVLTLKDIQKAGIDKIPSHSHLYRWYDAFGIICLYGDQSNDGEGYIYIPESFFNDYVSITIEFKAQGNSTNVTYAEAGTYNLTWFGGGMATIVGLVVK